jgi:hypothetical protein
MAPGISNDGIRYTAMKDITAADATDIAFNNNALMVDVAGTVKFSFAHEPTTYFTRTLLAGVIYPIGSIYSIQEASTATGIAVLA